MRHYNPATHCNTLQSTANTYITWKEEIHRKDSSSRTEILQHCATHCNTLQHSATLCNTLQQCIFDLERGNPQEGFPQQVLLG